MPVANSPTLRIRMVSPTFCQVESWRWVVAQWLSLAGFKLRRWWLDKGDVPPGCWLFEAGICVPFNEVDQLWLQGTLEGHPNADDYHRQLRCWRFMRHDKTTQLMGGVRPGEDERPTWNPAF